MTNTQRLHRLQDLAMLDRAIADAPDSAVNYLLRAEFWLKNGHARRAIPDLEMALKLGQAELQASDWEYREQALLDRAHVLLRLAKQHYSG
jgi:hypothetical protein